MTEADDGEWSAPAIYGRGVASIQPRLFAEANPVPAVAFPEWEQLIDSETEAWSTPTYVGRRKHRPRHTAPASPRRDTASTVSAAESEEALARETERAGQAQADQSQVETNQRVLSSSRTMAIASLVSRITGFIRSALLAAALGFTAVGDAYNSANSFPNMVYELLLGGVLSSVLIPLIVHAQERDSDNGDGYTQRLLSITTAALGVATLVAVAAAPLLASLFVDAGPKRDLTSVWATLLLPEIFFYGVGALYVAVLNTRQVYGPGAWSPVLNNVIVIGTIVAFWLTPGPTEHGLTPQSITTTQIVVLGLGTTLGIVAQSLVLVPALKRTGFKWLWRFRAKPNEMGRFGEVASLAGWVIGYAAASQLGLTILLKIANKHVGGVTSFTYADLLFQMPYGIIGVSLLTALMPRMSRAAARSNHAGVIRDLSLGARLSAVALLPVTAILMVLGPSLGTMLFSYHANDPAKGARTGSALAWSAFGLVPFAFVMLQLRVFYAMRDARTPTLINICMVSAKIAFLVLADATLSDNAVIKSFNVATSASYVVGAVVGHILLTKRLGRLGFTAVAQTVIRVGIASAVGAVVGWLVLRGVQLFTGTGVAGQGVGFVIAAIAALAATYVAMSRLRVEELRDVRALVGR